MTASVSTSTSSGEIGTILTQLASTLSATGVAQVADAVSNVAKDVNLVQNPTLEQRINQLKEAATNDVTRIKDLLINNGSPDLIRAAFDGLPAELGIVLSESELFALEYHRFTFSAKSVLGFYASARFAKLEEDIQQLELVDK